MAPNNAPTLTHFGLALRRCREREGLSLEAFADALHRCGFVTAADSGATAQSAADRTWLVARIHDLESATLATLWPFSSDETVFITHAEVALAGVQGVLLRLTLALVLDEFERFDPFTWRPRPLGP